MIRALLILSLMACDPAIDRDYFAHPIGASFSPLSGRSTGGEPITILGDGLDRVVRVSIGGVNAEIAEQSERSLRVVTPAHAIGPASVELESDRIFSFDLPYRYLPSRIQFAGDRLDPVPSLVVATGELDGDPRREIAVLELPIIGPMGPAATPAIVHLGEPGEPLVAALEIPGLHSFPEDTELQAVDLDRDGLDDLILYHWDWYDTLHDVQVLMNRGGGVFERSVIGDDVEVFEGDFFSADLDFDGALDIGWMGGGLLVFWGHGDGTFEAPATFPVWPVAGERKKTLASTVSDSALLAVNLEAKEAVRVRFSIARRPWIERAPYDSDLEVIAMLGVDLVLADATGALFVDRCSAPLVFAGPQPVAERCAPNRVDRPFSNAITGDLNGDGDLDLYGWSINEDGCVLYGDGDGGFVDARPVPYDRNAIQGGKIADFDGDGNDDLLRIETSYTDSNLIWHRYFFGPGMLRLPVFAHGTVPIISQGEVITVVGDRTVVAAKADGSQRILQQLDEPLPGSTRIAAVSDFSGDGADDLLLLTTIDYAEHPVLLDGGPPRVEAGLHLGHGMLAGAPGIAVLREDGGALLLADRTLRFDVPPPPDPVNPQNPERCLLLEDLNGDSIAELIQSCFDDRITIRIGALDGDRLSFGEPQVWTVDYWLWHRPFLLDLDADGDLDLMGTGESGVVEVRFNDGLARFDDRITLDLGDEFELQGIADVDGDGVRELLIYRFGKLDLELLRWRTPRQLDGPYAIQDLAHHDPPWREPPIYAIDFPDAPGIHVHEDLTGDGLADLVMFTRSSGFWPYSAGNLLLLENVSW